MIYCQNCGAEAQTGNSTCPICGEPTNVQSTTAHPSTEPTAEPTTKPPAGKRLVFGVIAAGVAGFGCILLLAIGWLTVGRDLIAQVTPPPTPTATPVPAIIDVPDNELLPDELPTLEALIIPGTNVEIPNLTEEAEIMIGREVADELIATYGLFDDVAATERVDEIGQSMVEVSDRPDLTYEFAILDSDDINAFAAPGGFIFITRGMLDFVATDDELAAVLGHEIAHVARRHGARAIEALVLTETALQGLLTGGGDSEETVLNEEELAQMGAQLATNIAFSGWSRTQELGADQFGTIYMAEAGYDPQAVLDLLTRMAEELADDDTAANLLASHPAFPVRIRRVERTIRQNNLQ